MSTAPGPRPGRPRDPMIDQRVFDAALSLLIEVGFEAMSIEGVAARAGVGKTAIYRRWSSKEALVEDMVHRIREEAPIVDTGDLRADLATLLESARQGTPRAAFEGLLPRFLAEAGSNPALFAAYRDSVLTPRLRALVGIVERARARGEVREDVDPVLVMDMLTGALLVRTLISGAVFPSSSDFDRNLIDTLWRGIAAPGGAPYGSA